MLSIYNASAGSGKTFTLTREYLRLLLQDQQPISDKRLPHSRILAVTFTKKATAEMKERILKELYIMATDPTQSDHAQAIIQQSGKRFDLPAIQQQAQNLLIGILQDYSRFSVSTIDGFFQQVIRTFAKDLGLSATYDLSLDGDEMIQEAVDEIFKRIRTDETADKELINWILDFIQKNINEDSKWNPNESIKLFSRQLLQEQLMRRMNDLQKVFEDKNFIRTYRTQLQQICDNSEKLVAQLLQQAANIFATEQGWNKDICSAIHKSPEMWLKGEQGKTFFSIIDNPEKVFTKSKTTKEQQLLLLDIYHQQIEPIFLQLAQIYTDTTTQNYLTAKEILPHLYTLGILQDVQKQVETTNRNVGRLPISSINHLINQVIDNQDSPFIYERFGQYFHHYMIDEFQDTSALQWENFSPLIHEAESNRHDNLVVGDVKQSIYRFRNSDWRLLKQVAEQFHPSKVFHMPNNWRTAPIIVQENEKLIQTISTHIATQLCNKYAQSDLGEDLSYIFDPATMHQEAAKQAHGYFHLQFFEGNDADEQTLETLHLQLQSLLQEGIDLKRVTILTRYTAQAKLLAQHLVDKGYCVQSSEGLQVSAHPAIQLLINLLKQEGADIEPVHEAYIKQHLGELSQEQKQRIIDIQHLPIYEQVQQLINILQLADMEGVSPYITSFLDIIYQFTKTRVADRKTFLQYWERKGKNKTIPSSRAANSIQIMTIHSSKGLEFDIVFIPFFNWEITKTRPNDIIWCEPQTEPFNQLPLVAVHPSKVLLQSHFKDEYIQEQIAQSIDNLNLTYVAVTRPKYRLYIYGQVNRKTTGSIGAELFTLYKPMLNDHLTYSVPAEEQSAPLPALDEDTSNTIPASYVYEPIDSRLTLRSRAEDDFIQDTPLAIVNLGILMHLWLSHINTWQDAQPALARLMREGQVTEQQAIELREEFTKLQTLIERENHNEWFTGQYTILSERNILTPSGNTQRPDRVMIKDNHAIVIDYKFGHEQPKSHLEQVRDYMLLLQQMGYTTEGYIIYNALQTIQSISI
jgi:ATP-dependent exoDNAse (exonuclease V) beta subunit